MILIPSVLLAGSANPKTKYTAVLSTITMLMRKVGRTDLGWGIGGFVPAGATMVRLAIYHAKLNLPFGSEERRTSR